jgi:hypothetical protein
MKQKIYREAPIENVYTPDVNLGKEEMIIPTVPMKDYAHFIRPADDKAAVELGGETEGLLGDLMHEVVEVPIAGDGGSAVHAVQKFL